MNRAMSRAVLYSCFVLAILALPLQAAVQPKTGGAQDKTFRHPDLYVPEHTEKVSELAPALAASAGKDLKAFGISSDSAFYDSRVGRWSSLILSEPLVPGTGKGNNLRWPGSGAMPDQSAVRNQVSSALSSYLSRHQAELRLDSAEFGAPRISVLERGGLVFVYIPRIVGGVPVRNSSIGAAINHGNLILLGLQNWGDVHTSTSPVTSTDQARAAVTNYARPFSIRYQQEPHLELIPTSAEDTISYRLAWAVPTGLDGDDGSWEGLVDAHSGELLAFEDTNQYAQRTIVGGVYPVSNDQRVPDGVEQTGWPMPFADILVNGSTVYSDSGGNIGCATGNITTHLAGKFVRISDLCGQVNETSGGSLDLGSGPTPASTNCNVPAGHSPGDTKSSRSGFFELNQIIEQAKGWLPDNTWLQGQLTANMNLNATCNAFWDGSSVNFFKSGGGCANTGEIAGVFDHEWGHGLDNNGVNPNIAGPGESIADIRAMLRLDVSCIGRGFSPGGVCDGFGDACTGTPADGCTGVRDINYNNHECNLPHTITWVTSGFTAAQCSPGHPACGALGSRGPCNRETHCEGMVAAEAAFDLQFRDLQAAPFNYDSNMALEVTTRLLFLGAEPISNWYTCSVGGGCGATGGYLSLLAVDDDNGDITDGTPHMTAIRAAFERHEIHCATPAAVNSGCANGPTTAPTVTATAQDAAAVVSWDAVDNASLYYVYRTDGVHGCDFGKIKVGETSDLSMTVPELQNGRDYYFSVIPVGDNLACLGPMSACATVTPVAGPNLAIQGTSSLEVAGGDGDAFLDNCETGTVTFTVANTGQGTLTNVQLVTVTPLTHPLTVINTSLPSLVAATLGDCATTQGTFEFVPHGMAFGETTQLLIEVTADELAGATRSQIVSIGNVESDAAPVATRTYSFEGVLEGWTVTSGTFFFETPGANGTGFHLSSSENVDNACDIVQSPPIRLTPTSTLSLYDHYTTESPSPTPYDRANVGVRNVDTNARTTIKPSSGRLYELAQGAPNGVCVTNGQGGWAGNQPTFAVSNWNAANTNPGGAFTGQVVKLEVAYGTDGGTSLAGFDFDEVTLTNFEELVPDARDDSCVVVVNIAPESLEVDVAGNHVLDPNETVFVSPTWGNLGNTVITLTGTAGSFTGPNNGAGDPTYGIPDANGDYGSINIGATAQCTDCYSLSLTTLTRPIQHWDATFIETMAPVASVKDGGAPAKQWTLHVGGSFTDVSTDIASDPYYPSIETIYHNAVTGGCHSGTEFCPANSNLRSEMAVFLLKASQPPGYTPPDCTGVFTDVPCPATLEFPFSNWIEDLYGRNITAGCSSDPGPPPTVQYCPDANILRSQMAVFLLKASQPPGYAPPGCTGVFTDVPCPATLDFPYSDWIEDLYGRGITGGCASDPGPPPTKQYCPDNPVLRQEMAVFLTKTFSLVLYGL